MANPPTFPSDGRMTTLQNFTGTLTGGELFEVVSPGNPSLGVNYNINATTLAANLLPLSGAQSPNTVFAGPASGVATAAPVFRALVPLDLPGLVRNAVASSYAVATTDRNKLIGLGGNPAGLPFVLSLSTASNFTTGFPVTLYNESTTRGWAIAPNGVATFILWPLQTVQVFNDNNAWKLSPAKQPWVVPANTTFNVDNVNGTDSSANDGLGAQGTNGAFATVQNAFNAVQRLTAQLGATLNIQLPPVTATAITEQITVGGAMPEGVETLNLLGNISTATNCQWQIGTGQVAATQSDYQSITYNGIGFSSVGSGATFVAADQYCIADFDNCDFGSNPNGVDVAAKQGAKINIISGNSISGQCAQFLQMTGRANVSLLAGIRVVGTSNVGLFLNVNQGAMVNVNGLSFTGNTSGLSGQQFLAQNGGLIVGNNSVSWPSGMSAGTTASGGISDAGLTNSALAQMNASTLKGNNTNTTGGPFDLTGTQVAGITEQGMTLLNVLTPSNQATVADTTSLTAAYNDYFITFDNLVPATSGVNLLGMVQANATFQTTSYLNQAGGATTYIDMLAGSFTLGTSAGLSATLQLYNVNSTSVIKMMRALGIFMNTSAALGNLGAAAAWNGSTSALTGLAFQMSTGNIASGTIKIYGLRSAL